MYHDRSALDTRRSPLHVLTSWPLRSGPAVGPLTETIGEPQALREHILTLVYNSRGHQINEIDFAGCLLRD